MTEQDIRKDEREKLDRDRVIQQQSADNALLRSILDRVLSAYDRGRT